MFKVEAPSESAAESAHWCMQSARVVRRGAALLVDDDAAGLAAYICRGHVVPHSIEDDEVFNAI